VQIVEFDVSGNASAALVGTPLREAALPRDARVAGIVREGRMIPPYGDASIQAGDRVIVIGSPDAARAWSTLLSGDAALVDDVVVAGAGRVGLAVARVLLDQGVRVRLVESRPDRATAVAELLPGASVLEVDANDPGLIERERLDKADAAVLALGDDAHNLLGGVLAKVKGIPLVIAIEERPGVAEVYEAAGIDATLDPRMLAAEEIVRFAHDPRTQQVSMLDDDRFEILDVTCRAGSRLLGKPLRELPATGSFVGAIIRGGKAIIPHGDDRLQAGDRAILFTESRRAAEVERAL
jgi:trk system potassium uptake protein TrkA